jgi:nitrite reductase/ring-hydroxylating ferredoxin subunit
MLEFFIPPAFYLLSKQFSFNTWAFGTGEFDYAFITSVIFICVTAVAAVMVDVQILLKMFVSNSSLGKLLTSKQDVYVMMNWICSFIVMFTLPSVMSSYKASIDDVQNSSDSFDAATNLPALQPATKAGIVLGFSAISYLMGYFGLLLELKHQDHKSKNVDYGAWKQYIPPLFYLIITLFAFRAHSTIAALIASVFFAIYIVNALVTRTQFSLEKLSLKPKAVPPPVQMVTAKTQQNVTCDPSTNPNVANDQALFKLYTSPPGNESKKWLRQIGYDITVYILPLTVVPLAIPILQIPATILCLIVTIWKPIYEYAARLIYLQPSKPQEPHRVADRKKSYPAGAEFPRGWFRLLDSSELPRMRVKYIQAMGRDLAIFRGEDGKVRCLDAYCIHLGANMAIGGQVVGNCLECPFHKWSFAGDGMCSAIPYSPAKVPATARTTAYHVIDFYGQICVWFPLKAEETPPSAPLPPPDYFPLPYEKIENGNMVLRGATKLHINMHLQEVLPLISSPPSLPCCSSPSPLSSLPCLCLSVCCCVVVC